MQTHTDKQKETDGETDKQKLTCGQNFQTDTDEIT